MVQTIQQFVKRAQEGLTWAKVSRWFGFGGKAQIISAAVGSSMEQENLLLPENRDCLKSFVKYGHQFTESVLPKFFKLGDKQSVCCYLERGDALSEEAIAAVLNRQDKELTEVLLASKSWVPFPYGTTLAMVKHHEQALEEAAA